jgi:putative ABC transport system permease protein
MADNLERERQRVMLTAITLAIGLTMIIGMTGITQFIFSNLVLDVISQRTERKTFAVIPFDISAGMAAFSEGVGNLEIPLPLLNAMESRLDGIADIGVLRIAAAPQLSPPLFGSSFSYVIDPVHLQRTGDLIFTFSEGDWETAMPIMESGCGLLVAPAVAARYDAGIGDSITVQAVDGAIECIIAGLGASVGWASIISSHAGESFGVDMDAAPLQVAIVPRIGTDSTELENILDELTASYPDIHVVLMGEMVDQMSSMVDSLKASMNAILILAIFAAALGIINTTMMSVHERRHELGLLRAVGATRGQVRSVVMGEAALMGLVGAFLGLLAGCGMTIIFVVTYGGNSVGISDLALWPTALEVSQSALFVGVFGLFAAPLISAFAAWFPTRDILHGATVETFNQGR